MRDLIAEFDHRFPRREIRIRCGLDRYGFSHLLSGALGYSRTPRFFGNWLHGWIWWRAQTSEDLQFDSAVRHKTHVVSLQHELAPLRSEGFRKAFAAGLPFAYVPPSDVSRIPGSLLAMPPHSGDATKTRAAHQQYLAYLESLRRDFELICVCLHANDATKEALDRIRSMGLVPILGASPNDANALLRMRAIFDGFEYVTSNTLGSHVAYALYAGCKMSLTGPLHEWSESDLASEIHQGRRDYLDRLLTYYSHSYIREHFGYLLHSSPSQARAMQKLGAELVGASNVLTGAALLDVLSWDPFSQACGYLGAAGHRLRRSAFGAMRVNA